jgi:hypothetical protein
MNLYFRNNTSLNFHRHEKRMNEFCIFVVIEDNILLNLIPFSIKKSHKIISILFAF